MSSPNISRLKDHPEFATPERCFIVETLSEPALSVARARVERGVTTAWHSVDGTVERYVMAEGHGRMWIGESNRRMWGREIWSRSRPECASASRTSATAT
jgi:hypothetical protein